MMSRCIKTVITENNVYLSGAYETRVHHVWYNYYTTHTVVNIDQRQQKTL